jgi:hypothetical protein
MNDQKSTSRSHLEVLGWDVIQLSLEETIEQLEDLRGRDFVSSLRVVEIVLMNNDLLLILGKED